MSKGMKCLAAGAQSSRPPPRPSLGAGTLQGAQGLHVEGREEWAATTMARLSELGEYVSLTGFIEI